MLDTLRPESSRCLCGKKLKHLSASAGVVLQTHGFSALGCWKEPVRKEEAFRVRRSTWCIAKYKLAPPLTKRRQRVESRRYHISIRGRSKIIRIGSGAPVRHAA